MTYEEIMVSLIAREYNFVTEALSMEGTEEQRAYISNMWEQTLKTVNTCRVFGLSHLPGLIAGILQGLKYAETLYNKSALWCMETALEAAQKVAKCASVGRVGAIPMETLKAAQDATEAAIALYVADYKKGLIISDIWSTVYYGRNSINFYDTQVCVQIAGRTPIGYKAFNRSFKRLQSLVSCETWEFPNDEEPPPDGGGGKPLHAGRGRF